MKLQMAGTVPNVTARIESRVLAITALTAAAILVAFHTHAGAVTLTNRDTAAHDIEVMVKSIRRAHKLKPGKSMAAFCAGGCVIRLNGSADNDYALEGSERISIEGGLVYYDGEEIKRKDDQVEK